MNTQFVRFEDKVYLKQIKKFYKEFYKEKKQLLEEKLNKYFNSFQVSPI